MNTTEKEKQQKVINILIAGVEFGTRQFVKVKDSYREKLTDLNMNGLAKYSQEYLEKEIEKVKSDFAAQAQKAYDDMVKRLEELRTLLNERDAVLDLSNPALTNALSLIRAIGDDLSHEEAVKINANFVHDQSGLRALRAAYKANGVISPGEIDGMIYSADAVIDHLIDLCYGGFVQEGSINAFASAFSKLAKLEGMTVESTPDAIGLEESFYRGAGLQMPPLNT